MENLYSERILKTPKSFIREILKVTDDDSIISFAGGLPNPTSFPQEEMKESIQRIMVESGAKLYQYSSSEGLPVLRAYIAQQYQEKHNLPVTADDILITTGSQQGLDLMGKALLNKGDKILVEKPGYLGAIQAFSLYEPEFVPVELNEDGLNLSQLKEAFSKQPLKAAYLIPNFQNPTGISYSLENRQKIGEIVADYQTLIIQDDPYGELVFDESGLQPYIACQSQQQVLFGTFSKVITPGMRIGWLCTRNRALMDHLIAAKQASDLHTNIFSQYLINDYLRHNDLSQHILKIRSLYQKQCRAMLTAIDRYFPKDVKVTRPTGGMFIWATLPDGKSAMDLFEKAVQKKVVFVPGNPFYTEGGICSSLRLNYTNADEKTIEEGIRRLASAM